MSPTVPVPSFLQHSLSLTSLVSNEYVFVVQIFHFFRVILRVGSVGSSVPRLSPTNFGESLCVDLQGFDPNLPGDFDEHPP